MPKNEDGEFELILGNRQLLSVFFIVVILLGVFFTMGYIVGRNSAPVIADATHKGDAKPLVVDSSSRTPEPAASPSTPPKETAVQQPEPPKPVEEKPVETAKAEPPPKLKAEPEKPAKAKSEAKAEAREKAKKEAKAEKAKPSLGEPSGTYLQLAATTQREAEIMVDVLRKKDFKAIAAEVPEKPGLFRVLVGPVGDSAVNKTRSDLQGAGFPGDKAIRRTF